MPVLVPEPHNGRHFNYVCPLRSEHRRVSGETFPDIRRVLGCCTRKSGTKICCRDISPRQSFPKGRRAVFVDRRVHRCCRYRVPTQEPRFLRPPKKCNDRPPTCRCYANVAVVLTKRTGLWMAASHIGKNGFTSDTYFPTLRRAAKAYPGTRVKKNKHCTFKTKNKKLM